jgi:hypothetical protein
MACSIPSRKLVGVLCAAGLFAAMLALPAHSQTPEEVLVRVERSVTFPLPRQPQRLASEDPSVAVVELLEDGKARVTGVSPGTTRIVGRDHAQVPIIIQVRVLPQ